MLTAFLWWWCGSKFVVTAFSGQWCGSEFVLFFHGSDVDQSTLFLCRWCRSELVVTLGEQILFHSDPRIKQQVSQQLISFSCAVVILHQRLRSFEDNLNCSCQSKTSDVVIRLFDWVEFLISVWWCYCYFNCGNKMATLVLSRKKERSRRVAVKVIAAVGRVMSVDLYTLF